MKILQRLIKAKNVCLSLFLETITTQNIIPSKNFYTTPLIFKAVYPSKYLRGHTEKNIYQTFNTYLSIKRCVYVATLLFMSKKTVVIVIVINGG